MAIVSGGTNQSLPQTEMEVEGVIPNWADPAIKNADAMPNQYFQFFDNKRYDADRHLYDALQTEAINQKGNPMMYYRISYDVNYDPLFGVDDIRRIERRFPIKAAFELPKQLENYGGFGLEGLDNFPMYVSKRHFAAASKYPTSGVALYPPELTANRTGNQSIEPRVGDLIKSEFNGIYYEVVDSGEEEEMFLEGKHTWTLTVQKMKDKKILLSAATSAAMDEISEVNDTPDTFDAKPYVDLETSAVLYDSSATGEESSNQDSLGGWFD